MKNMKKEYDVEKIMKMKEAAKICSNIFQSVVNSAEEGISLKYLDSIAEKECVAHSVIPAFKGYEGFPSSICTGVNDIVVHGIPDDYVLENGDIVSIDFGIKYKDVFSDMAITLGIGNIHEQARKLLDATKKALFAGISAAKVGNSVGDIGNAMESVVKKNGFSVVKEMVGHGIGYNLHEEPNIPGYGRKGTGERLYKGQTIAIEAIVNEGSPEILISSDDNWTTFTEDGMLSALFEHTVVVDDKPTILTAW